MSGRNTEGTWSTPHELRTVKKKKKKKKKDPGKKTPITYKQK